MSGLRCLLLLVVACGGTRSAVAATEAPDAAVAQTTLQVPNDFHRDHVSTFIHSNRRIVQGTVTFADWERRLVVLQEGNEVFVLRLNSTNHSFGVGDRIMLEGECAPFIPALPDFPDKPARQEVRKSFESPTEQGDFYLSRMRGFLHPPATGNYTFWVASDDSSGLWLSDNEDPARARRIAGVPEGRYTGQNEWTLIASQQSQRIHLEAGRSYYIEVLQQEYKGRDFVAVAWRGPDFEREVIPGNYVSPWPAPGRTPVGREAQGVLWEYWTNFFTSDLSLLRPERTSVLKCKTIRVLKRERGKMPQPLQFRAGEPLDAEAGFHLVDLEGRLQFVSRAGEWLVLELSHGSSRITARVKSQTNLIAVLPQDSMIRVTGFFEPIRTVSSNSLDGTVWMSRVADIEWLDTEANWSAVPTLPQYLLSPANPELAPGQVMCLQGRVVARESPGVWRLQGNDTFLAYTSVDGTNWSPLGVPVELQLSNRVLTGIALASYATGQVVQVGFDHVSGLPRQLSGVNIGNPPLAGGFQFKDGTFIVDGNGQDIWHQADQCFFAYHPRQDDFQITAHLTGINSTDTRVKAVVMIRESLAADSPWAGIAMTPSQRVGLQARRKSGENAAGLMQTQPAQWCKLVRQRNSFLVRAKPDSFRPGQNLEVVGQLEWSGRTPLLSRIRFRTAPESSPAAGVASSSVQSPDGLRPVLIKDLWAEAESTLPAGYRNPLRSRIGGVITFQDNVSGEWLCFMQDKSGGARLQLTTGIPRSLFGVGDAVEIVGTPAFAGASSEILVHGAANLGPAEMPQPMPLSSEFPNDPSLAAQWSEAEGVIRSVLDDHGLRLMTRAGNLEVRSACPLTRSYVDCLVRVRGVFWRQPNPVLLLASERYLEVLQTSPTDPFSIPVFAISSVQTNKITPQSQRRTKIAGVVTSRRDDFLTVQDGTGGIRLETRAPSDINIGDEIQAVGFPGQRSYGEVLTEVALRRVGPGKMPTALELSSEDVLQPRNGGILASVTAVLIAQHSAGAVQTLDLQLGQFAFRASLPKSDGEMEPLTKGSLVRLTGVILLEGAVRSSSPPTAEAKPMVGSLELLLRQPGDVLVLEQPPWWNWKHTVAVCSLLLAVLAIAVLWIHLLRRRVEQRTRELRVAMDKLEKETRISATLAERDRLAGEIHDSIEQGLSAIVMQMEAASQVVNQPDEVNHYLTMVKNMAGFSRAEVQHAVWDMQSPLLENADLATALRRVAQEISAGDTPRVTVEIVGTACRLASTVEHHLLRIAQEAITNAVKHANPKTIALTLHYTETTVTLTVRDDGAGFDPQIVSTDGQHFGLQGLRSRAQKIDAELRINSRHGEGTCIELVLPIASPTREAMI